MPRLAVRLRTVFRAGVFRAVFFAAFLAAFFATFFATFFAVFFVAFFATFLVALLAVFFVAFFALLRPEPDFLPLPACLLTVAQAMRSASSSGVPRSRSLSSMCSA